MNLLPGWRLNLTLYDEPPPGVEAANGSASMPDRIEGYCSCSEFI